MGETGALALIGPQLCSRRKVGGTSAPCATGGLRLTLSLLSSSEADVDFERISGTPGSTYWDPLGGSERG